MTKQKATLVLEDGSKFDGFLFGFSTSVAGEVVFNTAMTGYTESLTDPSYKGQILVATYPIIGNYGVPQKGMEDNMLMHYESDKIQVTGLIVSYYSQEFSHWNAMKSLEDWMIDHKIPGIYGIDTRSLTKKIREQGAMLGKILVDEEDIAFYDPNQLNLVEEVSIKSPETYGFGSNKVLLIDCGVKNNIIRHLLKRDTTIKRVPWNWKIEEEEYDGLFISNGPGDPKKCTETIQQLRLAIEHDKPIFGICLGNQLMALAAGADTYKLKYGHRSHNQPVRLVGTDRAFITSQNHGFAVNNDTLPEEWVPNFINLNDQTNEGFKHVSKPFFSTQFHPEASSGPTDTEFLFDDFIDSIILSKSNH